MAKVKVSELRKLAKHTKPVKKFEYNGLNIELKTYLPIEEKIKLAAQVYASCVLVENGIKMISDNLKEVVGVYYIVDYYTNIILPKNVFEAYDILINTGLYSEIKNRLFDEISRVKKIIDQTIDFEKEKEEQKNKLTHIVKDFLMKIINKIPDKDEIVDTVKYIQDELDLDKIKFIEDFLEKDFGVDNEDKK